MSSFSTPSRRWIHLAVAFMVMLVAAAACFVTMRAPAQGQLLPDPTPPPSSVPLPCTHKGCRAEQSIVMDVDDTHYASDRTADVTALTGDIEAQIDAVAVRHPLRAPNGSSRRIIWTYVDGLTHECQHPTDAGILEIEDAEILDSRHDYVFFGKQREEARLAFRLLGCAGDERLRYPEHGTASTIMRPTYLSVYGTVGLISLLRSGGSNNSGTTAAILAALSGNSALAPNIGIHDVSNLRSVVRHRLVYGKHDVAPGATPAPGDSLSAILSRCVFSGAPATIDCRANTVPAR